MGSIESPPFRHNNDALDYDVLIIGAGLSGIYTLHQMNTFGLRAKVLEAGSAPGGTWYWNRYPGARFDSESYSYGFSWSQEVLEEWDWSEHFAAQPETLRYCEFLVDKFNLRAGMQFDTRVTRAHYQERSKSWVLTDHRGRTYSSRWLVTCMGILNEFTLPNIPGVHDFAGRAMHTARWPHDAPVSFEGKRVGVIGTGATGIQTITEVAKTAGHLTVFQRTPNWSAPLNNGPISAAEMAEIKTRYPEIFRRCKESYSCFIHKSNPASVFSVTPEEREKFWNELYETRGFEKWLSNFHDIFTDKEANRLYSEFIANKIRQRVHDPETAEKLIPKCHGFGTKRVPLESGYFEAFNRPNVELVDVKADPIERVTASGVKTRDNSYDLDVLIYATGFDAVTGAFTAIDFQGVGGVKLSERWKDGPRTFLGLFVESFPNMLMVMGPHQMFGNFPRSIEYASAWVAEFIRWACEKGISSAECTGKKVEEWTEHVHTCAEGLLANEVDSWMTGVNKNLQHKQKRIIARYNGPAPGYRARADDVAKRGYEDLIMT
ncbi:flavin-containing monooxygenase [Aspergillus lucknowensis]|uniref:FAD/NAD(P)-binding domain-containing protein n=1 Tax=Aspergillus lucknowensis TaxID=176173 RepID=A0ABR4LWT0_9EURO